MYNLNELNQFLERDNLLKLTQETDNLNRITSIKVFESISNNFSIQKPSGSEVFTCKSYQTFKEEVMPILYNLF